MLTNGNRDLLSTRRWHAKLLATSQFLEGETEDDGDDDDDGACSANDDNDKTTGTKT
jgi:hypothetical protein